MDAGAAGFAGREQGSFVRGFIEAVPKGKFVIIDMTLDGAGEFMQWNSPDDYWGAPFILTAIHDMGGNDGMKGNLSTINAMPFAQQAAVEAVAASGGHGANEILGTGLTPEGIDQVSRHLCLHLSAHLLLTCLHLRRTLCITSSRSSSHGEMLQCRTSASTWRSAPTDAMASPPLMLTTMLALRRRLGKPGRCLRSRRTRSRSATSIRVE